MREITVPLRAKGRLLRVRQQDYPFAERFECIDISLFDRNGRMLRNMTLTMEAADALRKALNVLDADDVRITTPASARVKTRAGKHVTLQEVL
jgi:hypothetical protein